MTRRTTSPATGARGRGFTLVEVLVSLAIVAIAGLVLATAHTNVMRDHDAIIHRISHDNDLALVRASLFAAADREKAEAWNDVPLPDNRKARWRAEITPTQVADLFSVSCAVEVEGTGSAAAYQTTLNLMLLRPTWSLAADRETLRADARTRLAERKFP